MNRNVLAVVVASLLSAAAGAAVTWLVAFPRAVAEAKASMDAGAQAQVAATTDRASSSAGEDAETTAVAAKVIDLLHAEQQAHDHDAVSKVVESLRAVVMPLRRGMTVGQHRAVLMGNAAAIAAVDTSDCPSPFRVAYGKASDAVSAYAVEFNRAPLSAQAVVTDMVSIYATGGIAIPVLLKQAAGANAELSAQAAAQERATEALGRLGRAAARYGVKL